MGTMRGPEWTPRDGSSSYTSRIRVATCLMDPVCVREPIMDPVLDVCVREPSRDIAFLSSMTWRRIQDDQKLTNAHFCFEARAGFNDGGERRRKRRRRRIIKQQKCAHVS